MKKITFIALIGVILIAALAYVLKNEITLQYLYAKYPDRPRHYDWLQTREPIVAKQIILHNVSELDRLINTESYPFNTIVISDSPRHPYDFIDLSMRWQCHECFDVIISKLSDISADQVVSTMLTDDSYYFDQILTKNPRLEKVSDGIPSPLEQAVYNESISQIEKLLNHGVNINKISLTNSTALDVAMLRKNVPLQKFLRDHGGKTAQELGVNIK